ncbi:hypothetical protein ABZY20_18220 [Streptomyces sp. NPDC006624]|uniref:hypothetical protein n=1 Tax=Streptomyces sp. NPDC006624 TaxID=3154892 RepID=UPI0033AF7549
MRLPARRIATPALCATLLLGAAGPAAVAADTASAPERAHAASRAPVPDADALLGQVESLGGLGGVITPVADLLTAVLKADDGQLPPSQAAKLSTLVEDAIDQATKTSPVAPPAVATPGTTTPGVTTPGVTTPSTTTPGVTTPGVTTPGVTTPGTTTPAEPLPQASTLPAPVEDRTEPSDVPEGLATEALTALEAATGDLFKAVTSGDAARVAPAVNAVVSGLVNTVAATLIGSKLPAPDLAGLPSLPKAP